jgi:hypothetical protein
VDNATGHYILHRSVKITRIQDITSTTPDTLQIDITATKPDSSTVDFVVVIPEGEERYTTLHGFDNSNACTVADTYLHTNVNCP